jgi:chromosome segregation ATPase
VLLQDHDALMKLLIDETKEALVDIVGRRDRAIEAARAFESSLSHRMEEYTKISVQLQELQRNEMASESQITELKRQLEAARKETAAAQANESDANQEIDEANNMIAELQSVTATLEERIRKLEEEKRDADAINQGLEDDKDEMQQHVAHLEAEMAEEAEKHENELISLKHALEADTRASKAKISELAEEVATLTCKLAVSSSRLQELEKSSSFAEINVAKVKAERDAAVEARQSLQSELERNRRQQGRYQGVVHSYTFCNLLHTGDAVQTLASRA